MCQVEPGWCRASSFLSLLTFFPSFHFGFDHYFSNFHVHIPVTCKFWFRRSGVGPGLCNSLAQIEHIPRLTSSRAPRSGPIAFVLCLDPLASLIWSTHFIFPVQYKLIPCSHSICFLLSSVSLQIPSLMRLYPEASWLSVHGCWFYRHCQEGSGSYKDGWVLRVR